VTGDATGPTRDVGAAVGRVRERIRAVGGDLQGITLVAVTKGFGPDVVEAVLAAGVTDIAESYAQELEAKAATVAGPRWHYVGRLQANKVRKVAAAVSLWQSIDRPELAAEVARRAPGARVLVQLDISGEPTKGGCDEQSARELVDRSRSHGLDVAGLMAVGPAGEPERARPGFRRLARLADELGLAVRSMGMSGDLEVAVEEGSTMVRVGRALFGPRPDRPAARPGPPGSPVTG